MKVLVLSVATGGGHLTTSIAIAKHFEKMGHDAKVVDTYEYIAPIINKGLSKGYLASTKYVPKVYGKVYTRCEKNDVTGKHIYPVKTMNYVLKHQFAKLFKEYCPDVIICSHVMAAQMVDSVRKYINENVVTIGIITDFTIHPYWEDTFLDYYITASELLNYKMIKKGIPLSQVKAFGIPVDPKFAIKLDKKEAREILGIKDTKTLLIMSGSMGYGNVIKNIIKLDALDDDFQMLIVCGNNKALKKKLEALATVKEKYVYGFTDKVDVMMSASDCIITKPGGLTVSEALAKEIPMILMNPIPGQEDRNMEFLLNNGAARAVSKTYLVDEAVNQLFGNDRCLENARNAINNLSKPNSTRDLCEFVIKTVGEEINV